MHNIYPLTNDYLEDNHPGQSVVKKLTINVPYGRLDDESYYELKEALSEHFMGYFESINILHMPHERLDLQYISKYYSDYFCYRWYDWMKLHYETLDKGLRPHLECGGHACYQMWNLKRQIEEQKNSLNKPMFMSFLISSFTCFRDSLAG